jgi:hypothetical protein
VRFVRAVLLSNAAARPGVRGWRRLITRAAARLWRRRCNRLHELCMFIGSKRTCQAQLDQQNKSRRKEAPASPAQAAPGGSAPRKRCTPVAVTVKVEAPCACSDEAGGASSSPQSGTSAGGGGAASGFALTDEDALAAFDASAFASEAFDLDALLALDDVPAPASARAAASAPPPLMPPPLLTALAAEVAASVRAYSVHVKLPYAAPDATDLPADLNGSLARLLQALGVPVVALSACVRTGCVLLTIDLLAAAAASDADADAALQPAALLAALLADGGATGAFVRRQASVVVRVGDAEAAAEAPLSAPPALSRAPAGPRPPRMTPAALLSTSDGVLTPLPGGAQQPAAGAAVLACRLGADVLRCEPRAAGGGGLTLRACGLEGTLLVEALPQGTALHRAGGARPVLLCRDAAIVDEVCSALGGASDADADAAEHAVRLLGAAMAPHAGAAVLGAAATLAARAGLPATLARLARALRARCEADGAPYEPYFLRLVAAASACGGARGAAARAALAAAQRDVASGAALAASLLRAAERDGYALPCALQEAADALATRRPAPPHAVLAAASGVLAAMRASLTAPATPADEAAGAAADAAMDAFGIAAAPGVMDEAGYTHYVFDVNAAGWRTVGLLALFVHTVHMSLYYLYMRRETSSDALMARGTVLRKQVHSLRFYDPADLSLPPTTVLDYPWATVLAAAPPYVAWTLLVHIPTHIAILLFVSVRRLRPFVRRWYEPLFALLSILELTTYIFMDTYIHSVTGRVPRYAFSDCVMHTLGVLVFHRTGPFRLPLSHASVLYRAAVVFGTCVRLRAWGMLLWPENAVQVAGLSLLIALAPGNDRRLRARYAEHVAAGAAAAAGAADSAAAHGKRKVA